MMFYKWVPHLHFSLLLLFTTWPPIVVKTDRILVLLPHIGKSHFIAFETYLHKLSANGHQVTVYSHFPLQNTPENYTDVSLAGSMDISAATNAIPPFIADIPLKPYLTTFTFGLAGVYQCARVLGSKPMQELIKSNEKYDLIITELFNSDCVLPFVYKFGIPHITLSSCIPIPVALDRFGNPDNPSYIANLFLPLTDKMDFLQRVINTVFYVWTRMVFYFLYDIPSELVARYHFGLSIPLLSNIARSTSLLLLNTHPIINGPKPYVPNIIEVAGLHLPEVKKLPQDISKFIEEAEHGIVFVSFGSLLKIDSFPVAKRDAMVRAFAQLKERVLWRWQSEIDDCPANLMMRPWVPQFDVLSHPKVKAFVTHSGLLGTIEAVHNAVPLVTVPFFGDQDNNAKNIIRLGVGIELSYKHLSTENILNAINEVLHNVSYKENAMRVSKIFHDHPTSPMETAIYWTEYILRHRGASHLQSAATELNIVQYLLLDIFAFLLVISFSVLLIIYYCVKTLFPFPRPKQKQL